MRSQEAPQRQRVGRKNQRQVTAEGAKDAKEFKNRAQNLAADDADETEER